MKYLIYLFIGVSSLWLYKTKITNWPTSDSQATVTLTGHPWIIDGDTITIQNQRIRLEKIDTCELGQPAVDNAVTFDCGLWAKKALIAMTENLQLTCSGGKLDRYDRLLAQCTLPDQSDVGLMMIRQGYAFAYPKYARRSDIKQAVSQAKSTGNGVWGFDQVAEPASWRRDN